LGPATELIEGELEQVAPQSIKMLLRARVLNVEGLLKPSNLVLCDAAGGSDALKDLDYVINLNRLNDKVVHTGLETSLSTSD
jgi:hypothetical protein